MILEGKLKAAFIFIAPGANSKNHRTVVSTPSVELEVYGVGSYDEAAELARGLVERGISAIELCGGFGIRGVAMVSEAVGGKAKVGVVRFDAHPALNWKSGDEVFK
ncbi:MAG: hypothetical protein JHC28_04670 [Thermoprotei archaeon]|nr:hypothetical protein [Thermoprotei archaeon]